MLKYSMIKLQPLRNHKFKLLEDLKYKDLIIPKGFTTDGASIPRIFWCLFPPNRTDYLPCAIVHDYLCDLENYKKADQYFIECMEELKIPKLTRKLFYYAVRIYHKTKYKQ